MGTDQIRVDPSNPWSILQWITYQGRIPMPVLLNALYLLVLVVLSPWLLWKALTTGKYRRGLWRKFTGAAIVRSGDAPCVWFHGVSVGEIHLLRQVIAAFRRRHPD